MPCPSGPVRWCPRPVSPAVCPLRKIFGVLADHAKALASGRLHDTPAVDMVNHHGTQCLQATDFRIDIISLYIEVDAAVVGY